MLIPALAAAGLGCTRATCAQDEVERNGECLAACNSDNNCARDERCNLGACELAPNGSSSGVASGGMASSGASSGTGSAGSSGVTGSTSRTSSSQAGSSAAGGSSANNSSTGATSNGATSNGATSSASIPASGSTSTGAPGSSVGSSSVGGGTSGSMDSSSVAPASGSSANSSSQGTASSTPLTSSSSIAPSSGSSAPGSSSAPPSSSAAPPDADLDTIPDAVDNCAMVANPGQEDEDLDGLGNVCDNCPGRANPGQDDNDNDTVGNACDPRPLPGDSIVLFDGFDGNLAATWVPNSGVWAQAGGVLSQSNTGDQNRAMISTAVDATNVTVEGSVFITNCATQPCRAGFVVRVSPAGDGWGCAISRDNGNARLTISQMTAFDLPGVDANGPGPDATMAPVLLRFTANGIMLRCEAPEAGQSITFAVPNVTSGGVGLRSRRGAVTFAHVTVIQSP